MQVLLFICFGGLFLAVGVNSNYGINKGKDGDLVKLHLVFRHGNRTPVKFLYPNDPYLNVTLPNGALIPRGALAAKKLGLKFREIYNDFLGFYKSCEVKALSSSVQRCVDTLTNMSTTMYPFMEQKEFKYTVIPPTEDKLLAVNLHCPNLFNREALRATDKDDLDFLKTLSEVLGVEITSFVEVLLLRDYIEVMAENDYEVPDNIKPYWGQLLDLNDKAWKTFFAKYKANVTGNLINKIAKDSVMKINSKRSVSKLHLYSGHDLNVDALLFILDAYEHVSYTGYVAFEVYKHQKEHYVKAFKDSNNGNGRVQIKIPGCDFKCPIEKFLKFAQQFNLGKDWCPKEIN